MAAHGGEWTTGRRREVHGLGIAAAAAVMARYVTDGTGADVVLDEMLAAYADLVGSGLPPMPGAVALLDDLAGRLPLAVASNTPDPPLGAVLAAAGLDGRFTVVVGPSDGVGSKPAPDVYLAACAALGAAPAKCHALEDSATGVAAALAAGLGVTGVSRHARLDGCEQVVSLEELVDRF